MFKAVALRVEQGGTCDVFRVVSTHVLHLEHHVSTQPMVAGAACARHVAVEVLVVNAAVCATLGQRC